MNAGMADRRRGCHYGDATSGTERVIAPARMGRRGAARLRGGFTIGLAAFLALRLGEAFAQDAAMLDDRVTQQSISETICRPGYAHSVAPPFDELMVHKDRLLAARGIEGDEGLAFALDRHVPIVLGGSPDAPANLDLLPWAGRRGERRKARAAVMLKRCVCEGKLSLADAQAAIVGNWSAMYSGFGQTSCDISRLDVATGDESERQTGQVDSP